RPGGAVHPGRGSAADGHAEPARRRLTTGEATNFHTGGHRMRTTGSLTLVGGLAAVLAIGFLSARGHPASQPPAATGGDQAREADREAIRQAGRAFVEAFNKGDAKAVAALWTEQGESIDEGGAVLRGRAEIEKAYAELFREKPGIRAELDTRSIRF